MSQEHITKKNIKHSNNRVSNLIKCGLGTLLILLCYSATAKEYYRWYDANGTLHFTDKPPRGGGKYLAVKGSNRATDQEVEEEQEKEANSPLSQANEKRCKKEKGRMNTLQNNKSIRMQNADGTSFLLSPAEIKMEMERSEKSMSIYCTK